MRRTADFHHEIAAALLAGAERVVDNATVLDAAVDVLDAHAMVSDAPIPGFLCARECTATRLPGWHDNLASTRGNRDPGVHGLPQ